MENQTPVNSPDQEEKPRKKKIWIVLLLLLFLACGAAYLIWLYFQKPETGKVWTGTPAKVLTPEAKTLVRYQGRYLSFEHYDYFKEKSHDVAAQESDAVWERIYLVEQATNSKKIAVTISRIPEGGAEENADFRMRETYPNKYDRVKFESEKISGPAFISAESGYFEKTFFFTHDRILAELAFSVNLESSPELEKEADRIAGSIIWK